MPLQPQTPHGTIIEARTGFLRLSNRWQEHGGLHIEHGAIEYSDIQPGWQSARWRLELVPGTPFVRIENEWREPACLLLSDEGLTLGVAEHDPAAHWFAEVVKGTPYRMFRSRTRPDHYLNVEHGSVEATPVEPAWWSAQWRLA